VLTRRNRKKNPGAGKAQPPFRAEKMNQTDYGAVFLIKSPANRLRIERMFFDRDRQMSSAIGELQAADSLHVRFFCRDWRLIA
jgi:hypothetical protein